MTGDPDDRGCAGPEGKGPYRLHILERAQKIGMELATCLACGAVWQRKLGGRPWVVVRGSRSSRIAERARRS